MNDKIIESAVQQHLESLLLVVGCGWPLSVFVGAGLELELNTEISAKERPIQRNPAGNTKKDPDTEEGGDLYTNNIP